MAVVYQIVLTSGELLAAIPEESINTQATSLVLVGRGTTEYGERLWNNLVHLLENFAGSAQPTSPLTGQTWYDTQSGVLKVYNGAVFTGVAKVETGSITNDQISGNAAIALSKLAPSTTAGSIIVTDPSKLPRYVVMTGDVSIANTGETTIQKNIQISLSGDVTASADQNNLDTWDLAVTVSNSAITASKIASSAITVNKLDSGAITTPKLADLAVTEAKLAVGAVTTDKLGGSAVTAAKIDSGAVVTTKIGDLAITEPKIANGALESRHFAVSSIPSTAYQALSVGTSALASEAVTEAKLGDSSVTVDKIAHGATADADFVLTYTGSSLVFRQFSGSSLSDFTVTANKLVHSFLTPDYAGLSAIPFSNEVNTQDLANTQAINIDYGDLS